MNGVVNPVSLIPHYSSFTVSGMPISEWFTNCPYTEMERNCITWGLIHIAFAFWHNFGDPFLLETELELMMDICEKFKPELYQYVDSTFVIFLYPFVVGKYGHLPEGKGYCDYIQNKVAEFFEQTENIAIQFQPRPGHTVLVVPAVVL